MCELTHSEWGIMLVTKCQDYTMTHSEGGPQGLTVDQAPRIYNVPNHRVTQFETVLHLERSYE